MGDSENTGKPRLLLIGDSASLHTGMGVAVKEIATRLYRMDKYEIVPVVIPEEEVCYKN